MQDQEGKVTVKVRAPGGDYDVDVNYRTGYLVSGPERCLIRIDLDPAEHDSHASNEHFACGRCHGGLGSSRSLPW